MKGQNRLSSQYPELNHLLLGCPDGAEITENIYLKTPEAFEKQRRRVAERGSHVSVVGIMLLREQRRIALVERIGSNAGLALPSGSVDEGETLVNALDREMDEEIGVTPEPRSVRVQGIEVRIFEVAGKPERRQHVIVATFVGAIAAGQEVRQTETATQEGITVGTYPVDPLPPLVFNDTEKVLQALPQLDAI